MWDKRQVTGTTKGPGEKIVKDIKRVTRKHYSSEEKIRIVLDGLRGEVSEAAKVCNLPISKLLAQTEGTGASHELHPDHPYENRKTSNNLD